MVPYDLYENHFEQTLTSPAQPMDWINRLLIHATVKMGSPPPRAKRSVNSVAPVKPAMKLRRPPQRSANPPRRNLPAA